VPAQARPAVVAVEEPGIEGGGQLAMAAQVAQRAQSEARGGGAGDGERVGVVEAERLADVEPALGQPARSAASVRDAGVLEDRAAMVPVYSG
jgi:hypothetical protein